MRTFGLSRTVVLASLMAATLAYAGNCLAQDGAPRVVATSPKQGETEVDPTITEITVTFDRDMGAGMSWTGGGPDVPQSPEGKRAEWRDQRTCVLPVKLEAARYYRIGINSPSHKNFRSTDGVPAALSGIYFTTKGASEELKWKVTVPKVVSMEPPNNAKDVDASVKELRVTFNVPMQDGCSWTGGGPEFPTIPQGQKPSWSADKKTCTLPVELKGGSNYRLGLNSVSYKNFRSIAGFPLDPVGYRFSTK